MRHLFAIILGAVCSVSATAQTPGDAFYIYRNDGQFNVFFRSDIDSITYSCYDKDSLLHHDYVTQVIYCRDSIFRVPLAVVDSVVLVPSPSGSSAPMGLSDRSYIHIPLQPACAMVNITGISSMPVKKETNAHAWMEVWDMRGMYFKKRVIIDLNGDSSTAKEKKNFSADFCEDEWSGDETTDIKIGDWITQDGFHFKANYTSITKGECPVCYKLYDKFRESKPLHKRAPFMEYLDPDDIAKVFNGDDEKLKEEYSARCYPDGFPCIVYLNGQFYGIYSWQLKKHRDNYHFSRNEVDNIHLDGVLGANEFWNKTIRWSGFEIRNPKPKKSKWTLMCQDGTAYDGNNPKELMGNDSKFYKESDISCVKSAQTKAHIVALSNSMSEIEKYETLYKNSSATDKDVAMTTLKKEIERRFSMEWMIDYLILQLFIQNGDCIRKNWQWTTWGDIDGSLKWYVNPYDLDHAFGVRATTAFSFQKPAKSTYGKGSQTPARYVWDYYLEDMKNRYKELRDAGILSYETVWGIMKDWINRVGDENYWREAEKWPETPCNRDSYISGNWQLTGTEYLTYFDGNTNGWNKNTSYASGAYTKYNYRCYQSLKSSNKGHNPEEKDSEWWKDVTIKPGTYKTGDKVFDGRCNFYQFRALTDVTVSEDMENNDRQDHLTGAPFEKFYPQYLYEGGTHDSAERISNWIQEKIQLMDEQMGYKNR